MSSIIDRAKQVSISSFLNRIGVDVSTHGLTCCPIHREKTPSFKVYPETNSFYCFGCEAGGDVINLVQLLYNCSPVEASELILEERKDSGRVHTTGTEKAPEKPKPTVDYFLNIKIYQTMFEAMILTDKGKAYLKSRGLNDKSITHLLAYAKSLDDVESEDSEYCDTREKLLSYLLKEYTPAQLVSAGLLNKNGLVFPDKSILFFHYNSISFNIENLTSRNYGECRMKSTKLSGVPFENWESWEISNATPEIYIFEGIIDAVSFWQYYNHFDLEAHKLISTCGKPKKDFIDKLIKENPNSEINLCFDNDSSGKMTVEKLREQYPRINYFDVSGINENAKDWNDIVKFAN